MTEPAPDAGRARPVVGWTALALLTAAAAAVVVDAVVVFLGH
ncbi:hypothetical protein ACFQ8T_01450 [Isoptericola sp. NPDC056618]